MTTFAQSEANGPTTISELKRVSDAVNPTESLGCYAYATQSGVRTFSLYFGADFWASTANRWLLGIDYGRTHPDALRRLAQMPNAAVRIYDGAWVVDREGFVPRQDYHAKAALFSNAGTPRFGVVVGSGNFSSNGLRLSVEAGSSDIFQTVASYQHGSGQFAARMEAIWATATPVEHILNIYEERWLDVFSWSAKASETNEPTGRFFWIEAGYVTQNRGPARPGNQIDFPRGTSRFFGFNPPDDLPRNSVIGPVTVSTLVGPETTNNIRLGNNMMEKMSLPIPETHGFNVYDGKILVFERTGQSHLLQALESADFDAAFGSRIVNVHTMNSGRQYGAILA
jgi:hypothetical protein